MVLMLLLLSLVLCRVTTGQYNVDDSGGTGPKFDGIGGLSAGASSALLPSYSQEMVSQILDLLFKPNFGASLQICKVEIGGDGQSTDGTESSHMHSQDDENYHRGYEWWIMTEAKKRNPNVKLYGLPWTFPAWVGNGSGSPYKYPELTAGYIVKWIQGAKSTYGLDIDYIGVWNERNFDSTYIKTLRKSLDSAGLNKVQIVAPDGSFSSIADAVLKDPDLADAVSILGAHYPGTNSPDNAHKTGKPLWSSEDYSTFNDDTGAGCWARILNQNYVNGNMTSTITWNTIAAYYYGLPFYGTGLMTAVEPWSGHYEINGPIYTSAHTTQFTKPGDVYLLVGSGSGHLNSGGSYVSIMDPDTKDLTIIIETMSHDHSKCIRPSLPAYNVTEQTATFTLKGSFSHITEFQCWDSQLFNASGVTGPQYFINNGTVKVINGEVTVNLPVDHVMTLSTKTGQTKGEYTPPASAPFPVPYNDNFESYDEYGEAKYFADQSGTYEIRQSKNEKLGKVMMQAVPVHVISWCRDAAQTLTIMGQTNWETVSLSIDVLLPNVSDTGIAAFLAARVSDVGCGTTKAVGVFFWIDTSGTWTISSNLAGDKKVASGSFSAKPDTVYTLSMDINGSSATVSVNGTALSSNVSVGNGKGFVGFGTSGYFAAEFDNFSLTKAS